MRRPQVGPLEPMGADIYVWIIPGTGHLGVGRALAYPAILNGTAVFSSATNLFNDLAGVDRNVWHRFGTAGKFGDAVRDPACLVPRERFPASCREGTLGVVDRVDPSHGHAVSIKDLIAARLDMAAGTGASCRPRS